MLAIYLSMIDNEEDKSKFESVYLKYKNLMLNRAYDILKDSGLAEDAVHNAFLSILKNLSKIDDVNSKATKGYVLVIAENAAALAIPVATVRKRITRGRKLLLAEIKGGEYNG